MDTGVLKYRYRDSNYAATPVNPAIPRDSGAFGPAGNRWEPLETVRQVPKKFPQFPAPHAPPGTYSRQVWSHILGRWRATSVHSIG
jgi:hypothetical protein